MPGERIFPKGAPPPIAPYSPGMKVGNTVYVSGTVSMDADGNVVGVDDITAQTEKTIQNIKDVLEAAGAGLEDVVMVKIFLTDFKQVEVIQPKSLYSSSHIFGKFLEWSGNFNYQLSCSTPNWSRA